jgi:hypothetical protein
VEGPELPYKIEMEIALRRGRYECVSLTCQAKRGGALVTGDGIRKIPVLRLVGMAAARVLSPSPVPGKSLTISQLVDASAAKDGPTDDALALVARVYTTAYVCQYEPTKAVMESLRLSRPTAGRWVMQARERGLLGPTDERKAGGVG